MTPQLVRSIALYFDDTHAGQYEVQQATAAAEKLVAVGLQPRDGVGIFAHSGELTLDFTSDRDALTAVLARLQARFKSGPRSLGVCPDYTPYATFAYLITTTRISGRRRLPKPSVATARGAGEVSVAEQFRVVDSQSREFWNQFKGQSSSSLKIVDVVMRHPANAPGTRILVLFSPGFISRDLDEQKSSIVKQALRAHIVINALAGLPWGEYPQ